MKNKKIGIGSIVYGIIGLLIGLSVIIVPWGLFFNIGWATNLRFDVLAVIVLGAALMIGALVSLFSGRKNDKQ